MLISPSKRSRIAWTSCELCMWGFITARVVKPLDFSSGMRAREASHFLMDAAWCWSSMSEIISRQALLGPLREASSFRKAEVRAMLISVRFSMPFSLNTLGRVLMIELAWGLQMKR